ncbi:hypothetical protein EOD29_22960 [Mesorhizobium sp. M1A.T.Ca.IN.004.03.1.1]|nr:hypothetical protein EOD29_22960 [Mesorhizobium sp. M1A.T.Ca.IN.004.03.1.1]
MTYDKRRAAKHEATTESARAIIDSEAAQRNAKTDRLRAARIAQQPPLKEKRPESRSRRAKTEKVR